MEASAIILQRDGETVVVDRGWGEWRYHKDICCGEQGVHPQLRNQESGKVGDEGWGGLQEELELLARSCSESQKAS